MSKKRYKYKYKNIEDRSWGSLEAHDKAMREASQEAWERNSAMLPPNAFADDVPDDLDRDGRVDIEPTHVATQSILENH